MKLTCHRPSLATAFQIVSAVVPTRTPKEILKNVKLQVGDGKAVLIGTDQEVGIRFNIARVETDSSGEVLLPTNRVMSILRELQDDAVQFDITEDAIWIRSGHSEFKLPAEDPSEFPPVSSFDHESYFAIAGPSIKELIRRTIFATDVESTRYALGGIQMELNPEKITLAATDSRRLAVVTAACRVQGQPPTDNLSPVLPSKAMNLIEKTITEDDEEVQIAVNPNDALIKCGSATVYSRLVEGRFPKYRDVIPQETRVSIELVAGPFYAAVRQAQIITNEESRGVDFTFSNGLLTMNSVAAEIGESKIEMPISFEGEAITITFDPRFVADFLRIVDADSSLRLELIDAESAAVFRKDDAYTYVVMPLSRDR